MKFQLIRKSDNQAKTVFHVQNERGDVVGSINVKPSEVEDLLRHWAGPKGAPKPSGESFAASLVKSFRAQVPNRAAILRGC